MHSPANTWSQLPWSCLVCSWFAWTVTKRQADLFYNQDSRMENMAMQVTLILGRPLQFSYELNNFHIFGYVYCLRKNCVDWFIYIFMALGRQYLKPFRNRFLAFKFDSKWCSAIRLNVMSLEIVCNNRNVCYNILN